MNYHLTKRPAICLVACFGMLAAAPSYAASRRVIGSGTVVEVQLDSPLNSSTANAGSRFSTTIRKPEAFDNSPALPAGTRIEGYVRHAVRRQGSRPGMLDLAFNRVKLPGGRSYPIAGSLIGLDDKSVIRKPDGRVIARPGKRTSRLTYVGYGAGAGLLVSLLANRKRTLENTLIGAGLGYIAGAVIKDKNKVRDVQLDAGIDLGVRLDRQLVMNR